ncbi:hypothetical protein [Deinococcus aquaticus]|uniref:hypothetical protein n=1 Tax=Deinococcus aquaticus TaxID=328692 RepID=UPI003F477D69
MDVDFPRKSGQREVTEMSESVQVNFGLRSSDISVSSTPASSDISVNPVEICSDIWVDLTRTSRPSTKRVFGHLGQLKTGKLGHLGQFWWPGFGHLGQEKSENDVCDADRVASLMMINLLINQIL